jgi:hypothetical protein
MGGTPAWTSPAANRSMNRRTACSSRSRAGTPVAAAFLCAKIATIHNVLNFQNFVKRV